MHNRSVDKTSSMGNQIEQEERMGTEKMLSLVFRMSLPAIAAQIANLLYNIVDRIFIGHIPKIGTVALAGVGVTTSVIILISSFSMIVGGGGAPLASMALGKGDREKAAAILGNGLHLLVLFSFITGILSFLFMEPILMATGASANTITYATDYLSIYLIGTVFVQVSTGMNTFISSQGRPGIAMFSVLIGAGFNILLDALFIQKLGMGVKGAALATILSQSISAIWVIGFLLSKQASLRIEKKHLMLKKQIIWPMIALGISPFVMASTESIIGFVLNGNLERFGDIYVSTLTVLQSIMLFASVPLNGFAQGFMPVMSYNYGSRNNFRVRECFKIAMTVMFGFNFTITILALLFTETFASFFTNDPSLIDAVREMAPFFLTGSAIFGLQRACQNSFIALGEARISLIIALLRKVILLVPMAIIFPKFIGVQGIFLSESVADAIAATACIIIFLIVFPKILKRNLSCEK